MRKRGRPGHSHVVPSGDRRHPGPRMQPESLGVWDDQKLQQEEGEVGRAFKEACTHFIINSKSAGSHPLHKCILKDKKSYVWFPDKIFQRPLSCPTTCKIGPRVQPRKHSGICYSLTSHYFQSYISDARNSQLPELEWAFAPSLAWEASSFTPSLAYS